MFPFWEVAIAPLLEAAEARELVEIGALRGENTRQIIETLGPECILHVIDPVPDFDPVEHEQRFAGQYVFHRDLSVNVLGHLPPMDAALIDGDHNWFTVVNEMRLLAQVAREAGRPMPLMICHDVAWPYGRRDLYYDPSNIPAEHRQPYDTKGMRPGNPGLLPKGGLNPTMFNAVREGGPRNGVMTAVDDFIAGHDKPLRLLILPLYFGLAVVVEEERLAAQPALAAAFDRLESPAGKDALLAMAEEVRLRAMLFQHNVYFQRDERFERATARYLQVTKTALLNGHYLEHEARLEHMAKRVAAKQSIDAAVLRDPVRNEQEPFRRLVQERLGVSGPDGEREAFLPYTSMGMARLDHLEASLDAIRLDEVPGDLVEVGTGHGGGAIFLRAWLEGHELTTPTVWIVDRFRASPEPAQAPFLPPEGINGFQADLNLVRDGFDRFGLLDDRLRFLQGDPADTLAAAPIDQVALIRIGRGAGADAGAALEVLYPKLATGGAVIVDDRLDSETHRAVEAFRTAHAITTPMDHVDWSTRAWRKAEASEGTSPSTSTSPADAVRQAPLAPSLPTDALDLTVVVVFYNMRREAARTLHALSRSYQEQLDDRTYEVIVVENGSAPEQKVGDLVATFGPEFHYLDLGAEAKPSPVTALNIGIRMGRGRNFALMIDGAHVLTPGVLHFGLTGLETYAPAIVATQQWYVGPGQQGDAMEDGYDQAYEDRLFEAIDWPTNGYRLFEISHFIGDRDWLDGMWESNAMFAPRSLLEQVGCFDENFSIAGGGYANLELYERLGSAPDITVTTILGEGSFHQVHGGTTTNQPDPVERRSRVFGYSQDYADLRGRRFRGPGKPIHYVGRITSAEARRTKPRRLSAKAFAQGAGSVDAKPIAPVPMPDELMWEFTDAVWRTLPERGTEWLGHPIATAPNDLLAYQEIISRVRPDWVVETGTGTGGRALFLASMCDLVGHGRVLSVDADDVPGRPEHDRITYHRGRPNDPATIEAVRAIVGDGRAVVVIGTCTDRLKTVAQFEGYVRLVPPGSYVVVTDTVVNGHPVWTGFGNGPTEAVKQILTRHGEFVRDSAMEKYSFTYNPGGFLLRTR